MRLGFPVLLDGGPFVHLESPGDVVSMLEATKFALVDRVHLVNRTTRYESSYIASGIDGSFDGEVERQREP